MCELSVSVVENMFELQICVTSCFLRGKFAKEWHLKRFGHNPLAVEAVIAVSQLRTIEGMNS